MCEFKSGIILYKHKNVLHDDFIDHHSKILEDNNIEDKCIEAKFVRVEILPCDGNICNQDKGNWCLKVDQDRIPEWFDKEKAFQQMWRALTRTWDSVFVINKELKKLKNAKIRIVYNSNIKILDNSQVDEMWDNSLTRKFGKGAKIKIIKNNALVINYTVQNPQIITVNNKIKVNIKKTKKK